MIWYANGIHLTLKMKQEIVKSVQNVEFSEKDDQFHSHQNVNIEITFVA